MKAVLNALEAMMLENPDAAPVIKAMSSDNATKQIIQQGESPATILVKLAPFKLALLKFVPRMSASLKSVPERFCPLKD